MVEHHCHHCHCHAILDALDELRLSRMMHAMRPYLPSSPLPAPRPNPRSAPRHEVLLWPQPSRTPRIPSQRSRTAAEQEDRLNLLPGYRSRPENNRGHRA